MVLKLDITQGFPSDFGPVKIGKNVWLPARSIVLPNVTIGNDVVIGINSIINRSLPSGCLLLVHLVRFLGKICTHEKMRDSEIQKMIEDILSDWKVLKHKGIIVQ